MYYFIAFIMACICGAISNNKGYGFWLTFLMALFIWPLVLIMEIARRPKAAAPEPKPADVVACPYCAENVKVAAVVCKHCGKSLQKPDPAVFRPTEVGLQRIQGSGTFDLPVLTQANYQTALKYVAGMNNFGADGKQQCDAVLELEESNLDENTAVRVTIDGLTVGHLKPDHAHSYRRAIAKSHFPNARRLCSATIKKSTAGDYAVALDVIVA